MEEKLIEGRGGKKAFLNVCECVCAMCHSIFVVRWHARMRNKPLFFFFPYSLDTGTYPSMMLSIAQGGGAHTYLTFLFTVLYSKAPIACMVITKWNPLNRVVCLIVMERLSLGKEHIGVVMDRRRS
jgi:hypothetical protein